VPLQIERAKVVRAIGVQEFAAKVRMASPNLLRSLNPVTRIQRLATGVSRLRTANSMTAFTCSRSSPSCHDRSRAA